MYLIWYLQSILITVTLFVRTYKICVPPSKADGFMATIRSLCSDCHRNVIVPFDKDTGVLAVGGTLFLLDAMPSLFFNNKPSNRRIHSVDNFLSLDKFYWTTAHSSFGFSPLQMFFFAVTTHTSWFTDFIRASSNWLFVYKLLFDSICVRMYTKRFSF